jgi:anti-sigma-K factor RskA
MDDTPETNDEQKLSGYLLDDLDPGERERIEQSLAQDGALSSRVRCLAPLVHQLEQLPDDAWAFVAEQHADARRTPVRRPRWWQRPLAVRPALASTAAAALLAVGVGVGVLLERTPGSSGATVALRALPGELPSAFARARLTDDGHIVLVIRNLPASQPGTYYEAWLMTDTTRLVPVAAFRPGADGNAKIDVPLPAAAAGYRYIDISLQHAGAGTAHSNDSVLRGTI